MATLTYSIPTEFITIVEFSTFYNQFAISCLLIELFVVS